MKKLFALTLVLVLALSLLAACGGSGSGGGSTAPPAADTTAQTETGGGNDNDGDTVEWPDDEVGNLVSKPSFDYTVKSYIVGEGRKILYVNFPDASKEQIKSYLSTAESEIYDKYPDTWVERTFDDDTMWGKNYIFDNGSGFETLIGLKWFADSDPELMIEWILK
ncbi:MAG: hypothetical protein LBN00_11340 [Oscillospiraceae bacterium]|jgi:hypothetical protein|nr:hypothetical protein [Oscillospiraceae bacterium]